MSRVRYSKSAIAFLLLSVVCCRPSVPLDVVGEARQAVAAKDWAGAERAVARERASKGTTLDLLEALSLLAQGAFAAAEWDRAESFARSTYDDAVAVLRGRPVDQEKQLPVALGRAIEVLAQVSVERGERSDAVGFLERELATYRGTSIEKRIQKNINLLSLEGKDAPALDVSEYLGTQPPTLASLRGRVVLLFFWAHWCSDCKAQSPILLSLLKKYDGNDLTVVAPTQRFGYIGGDVPAAPDVETPYIESVRRTYYPVLEGRPIPLAEANHRRYGVSSTPTIVLVDRRGIIRLYHPGRMTEEELDTAIREAVRSPASQVPGPRLQSAVDGPRSAGPNADGPGTAD